MADTLTITEVAPDGTTTVIEIHEVGDDSSVVEDVIEAIFDRTPDANLDEAAANEEPNDEFVAAEFDNQDYTVETAEPNIVEAAPAAAEIAGALTLDEAFDQLNDDGGADGLSVDEAFANLETGNQSVTVEEAYADLMQATADTARAAETIPGFAAQPLPDYAVDLALASAAQTQPAAASDAAQIEQTMAADDAPLDPNAVVEAQLAADEFIARGDYAAAADARETAEDLAWQTSNSDALHGSDSIELTSAANEQTNAAYYQQQQAEFAQAGNYELAAEAAGNHAQAVGNADWNAGGSDHTAEARAQKYQLDYAAWEQQNADYYQKNVEDYLEIGNFDAAAESAQNAVEHQAAADYRGDLGEYGGESAVYDSTSAVETGGSYDAADYSSSSDTTTTNALIE